MGAIVLYIRVYEYQEAQNKRFRVIGFKGFRPLGLGGKREPNSYDLKLDESLCRTRRTIRDLILCNRFLYFCTFTFSDSKVDRYDLDSCKKGITAFFHDFRQKVAPDFRYLIVPERHKDDAWHFHGVVWGIPDDEFTVPSMITVRNRQTHKLYEVPNKKGFVRWERYSKRFGHFDCSRIKHYEACAAYVSKYITKSLSEMTKSKHLYFCSAGLARPDLVFDQDDVPFLLQPQHEDEFCKIAWASCSEVIGTYLPDWYDDWCADLREPEALPRDMTRAQLETYIFEPLTMQQLLAGAEKILVP